MLDVTGWTVDDLRGSRLREVVKHAMAAGEDGYDAVYDETRIDAPLADFAASFGWRPPRELGLYVAAEAALAAFAETQVDFWLEELGGWIFSIALGEGEHDALADPMLLLTGLVQFGMDASGDTCFMSALPHPDEIAEVWVYDHEVGEISHHLGYSTTDALLSAYLDEEVEPEYFRLAESQLGEKWERGRPKFLHPDALHARVNWLIGLLWGDPGYAFERRLGDAPAFATWVAEKSAAAEYPHLAAYWALAHYFFGNVNACAEAIEILRTHGDGMSALATNLERALKHDRGFGQLEPKKLAAFRALVARNAMPEQLEPTARAPENQREEVDVDAALAAGATELELIEQHPNDVELHDELLRKIASSDAGLEKLVERYFRERTDDVYSEWPYGEKRVDERLSIPVSAAFRAGLRYGASHKHAFVGITRTLAKFDDDHAIAAYRAAVESLKPEDARLEYVIEQLAESAHPEAHSVLVLGAHRFLDNLAALSDLKAAKNKEWPSLDDLFRVDDYFIRALLHAMRPSEDHTELQVQTVKALARKTLERSDALGVLGMAWARAMQVVAHHEMDDLVYLAHGYVEAFRDTIDHQNADSLRDGVIFNLAESARTLALRDAPTAAATLRPLFEAEYPVPAYRADVIGALLAGLLVVEPNAGDVLGWTERILGSRSGTRPSRLYGPLVGLATVPNESARDWIWAHLYAGFSGINASRSSVGHAALRAVLALGLDGIEIPIFDDDDWYANSLSTEAELLAALDAPHLHGAEDVLERFREEDLRSTAVALRVGDWLAESLRFAEDDRDRGSHRDRWEAMRVLLAQGTDAIDQFERVIALRHLGGEWLGYTTQVARFSDVFCATQDWLGDATDEELLDVLKSRSPKRLAFLDHVAAEALVRGLDVRDALRAANEWRAGFHYSYSVRDDLVASRLPRLFVMAGGGADICAAQLARANDITEDYWAQAKEVDGIPEPEALFDSDGSFMDLEATGECWFDSKLVMRAILEGTTVTLVASVEDFYTHNVLLDAKWSGEHERTFDDFDAALDYANGLLRRLAILGYTLTE